MACRVHCRAPPFDVRDVNAPQIVVGLTVGLPSPVQWMFSVRPPMSTERPICFSNSAVAPRADVLVRSGAKHHERDHDATSLTPLRTRRYVAFQAPPSGTDALSARSDEKSGSDECGRPVKTGSGREFARRSTCWPTPSTTTSGSLWRPQWPAPGILCRAFAESRRRSERLLVASTACL